MITDKQGFGWLTEDDFVYLFAGDIEPATAGVMHAVQQPLALSGFAGRMGATTVEVASGHVAMVSHPDAVADLIRQAAGSVAS
jgi:hypothetical protein